MVRYPVLRGFNLLDRWICGCFPEEPQVVLKRLIGHTQQKIFFCNKAGNGFFLVGQCRDGYRGQPLNLKFGVNRIWEREKIPEVVPVPAHDHNVLGNMERGGQVIQKLLWHGPVELKTIGFANRTSRPDPVDGIDQVIFCIIVILHIGIPGEFQGVAAFDPITGEDGIDVLHDHILKEHDEVVSVIFGKFNKPGDVMIGWDLDYSITLQLLALVAVPADHLQGHIGLPGFHKWSDLLLHQENRLNGSYDIGVENLTDKTFLLFSQLVVFIH